MLQNPECGWVGSVIEDYLYQEPPWLSIGDAGGYDGWFDANGAMMIDFNTLGDVENLAYTLIHEVRHFYSEEHNGGGYFDDEYEVADPCFEALIAATA